MSENRSPHTGHVTVTNGANGDGSGRAKDGRFKAGNQFAVGHRPSPYRAYTDAIRDAVSPEDLHRIMAVLRDQALQGNVRAAQVVLDRLTGKVRESVSIKIDDALPPRVFLDIDDDQDLREYLEGRYPDRYGS